MPRGRVQQPCLRARAVLRALQAPAQATASQRYPAAATSQRPRDRTRGRPQRQASPPARRPPGRRRHPSTTRRTLPWSPPPVRRARPTRSPRDRRHPPLAGDHPLRRLPSPRSVRRMGLIAETEPPTARRRRRTPTTHHQNHRQTKPAPQRDGPMTSTSTRSAVSVAHSPGNQPPHRGVWGSKSLQNRPTRLAAVAAHISAQPGHMGGQLAARNYERKETQT